MSDHISVAPRLDTMAIFLRVVLFLSAVTLALYIPFKYATQLHATTGIYAFLFPLSGLLAIAGITLSVKPQTACDCSTMTRRGAGVLAVAWLVTGLLCVSSLSEMILEMPLGGTIAMVHMLAQHVVLSMAILAFAIWPRRTAILFGAPVPVPARIITAG